MFQPWTLGEYRSPDASQGVSRRYWSMPSCWSSKVLALSFRSFIEGISISSSHSAREKSAEKTQTSFIVIKLNSNILWNKDYQRDYRRQDKLQQAFISSEGKNKSEIHCLYTAYFWFLQWLWLWSWVSGYCVRWGCQWNTPLHWGTPKHAHWTHTHSHWWWASHSTC